MAHEALQFGPLAFSTILLTTLPPAGRAASQTVPWTPASLLPQAHSHMLGPWSWVPSSTLWPLSPLNPLMLSSSGMRTDHPSFSPAKWDLLIIRSARTFIRLHILPASCWKLYSSLPQQHPLCWVNTIHLSWREEPTAAERRKSQLWSRPLRPRCPTLPLCCLYVRMADGINCFSMARTKHHD